MKKRTLYTIIGILFVFITGTLAHFVYEWSGSNPLVGYFFPVNESSWEHMKLCFFPMLVYFFFMRGKLKTEYPCVSSGLLAGILLGTFLIPVLFYTYSGILGQNYLVLDIATFAVSVILSYWAAYRLSLSCRLARYTLLLKGLVAALAICFFVFTDNPPTIALFQPPI